jgi:hypothetical protein
VLPEAEGKTMTTLLLEMHREGVPILTADREFERVADLINIAWLAD